MNRRDRNYATFLQPAPDEPLSVTVGQVCANVHVPLLHVPIDQIRFVCLFDGLD